jgi:hypothetical protein
MRKIKKVLTVRKVTRYLYNRVEKQEIEETVSVADGSKMPPLPENCILLDEQELDKTECTYEMSPETFFKYATLVEK